VISRETFYSVLGIAVVLLIFSLFESFRMRTTSSPHTLAASDSDLTDEGPYGRELDLREAAKLNAHDNARWVVIAEGSEKGSSFTISLDTQTAKALPSSGYLVVWTRWDFHPPETAPSSGLRVATVRHHELVDCKGRRIKALAQTFLDSAGNALGSMPAQMLPGWAIAESSSIGERELQGICIHVQKS
jgi:hypothetical protein